MLVEAVGDLVEGEAHVFQADLLAHDIERHGGEARMHGAHDPREHRAIAHARIKEAQGGRARADVGQLHGDPVGDHPLLRAGVHKEQIFLPVVEEAEVFFCVAAGAIGGRRRDRGL